MRLTAYTDYCMRVLMFLALRQSELCTISEIAEAYGISRSHLTKVVQHLGQLGYIETTRGKGGGIRLRDAAESIRLGQLVLKTEGDIVLVECFGPGNKCVITPACQLKHYLHEALKGFVAVLDQYTLADTVAKPQKLGVLLRIT